MNRKEFRTWFREFRSVNASIDGWIAKMPATAPDEDYTGATQDGLASAWFEVLSDVDFKQAQAATKALARGDASAPLSFQDFPKEIRRIARSGKGKREFPPGPKLVAGLLSAECPDCMDLGIISIFTIETIRDVRDGRDGDSDWQPRSNAIRCHCKWGKFYWGLTNGNEYQAVLFFQPKMMVPCEKLPTAGDVERLRDFFAARQPEQGMAF